MIYSFNDEVVGVVVTYNPDIELLSRNLGALTQQVSRVLLYDNASKNQDEIIELVKTFPNVKLFANAENLGLPINYNRAMKEANSEWLLTMDQDSVLPNNYIECASKYFHENDIAIICPSESESDSPDSFVERCVSSGSLNRLSTLKALGGFDESMFIDMVDFDYCKTVTEHGYKIFRLNNCVMEHHVGQAKFVSVFGKQVMIFNHSPIRKYYYFRNSIYYARKHGLTFRGNRKYYEALLKGIILLCYEKETLRKIFMSLKGLIDGFRMKLPQCYTNS